MRWRSLQWQITRSYILVTVIAALILECAAITALVVVVRRPSEPLATPDRLIVSRIDQLAPQAAPFMLSTSDVAGADRWLALTEQDSIILQNIPAHTPVMLMLVRLNGTALASNDPSAASLLSLAQVQKVLRSTRKNEVDGETLPGDRLVLAAPVTDAHLHVLGSLAAVVVTSPQTSELQSVRTFLADNSWLFGYLIASGIVLLICASVIGTVFGIMLSRRLTRRLGRISRAADAWSRGEFHVKAEDRIPDELGQMARHLNGMASQLRDLIATQQGLAVVEERQRLARDLHDAVKQQVFASAMLVAAAREQLRNDPQQVETTLAVVERINHQAQHELASIIHELRPAALAQHDLAGALTGLCHDWASRSGIVITTYTQEGITLDSAAEEACFRVAQEALANSARHSGASEINVRLICEEKIVRLAISDNGHGFDVTAGTQGIGLHTMRERVVAVGGVLHLTSTGDGTCVEVMLPARI
jgi:signal transduction histidine kinase